MDKRLKRKAGGSDATGHNAQKLKTSRLRRGAWLSLSATGRPSPISLLVPWLEGHGAIYFRSRNDGKHAMISSLSEEIMEAGHGEFSNKSIVKMISALRLEAQRAAQNAPEHAFSTAFKLHRNALMKVFGFRQADSDDAEKSAPLEGNAHEVQVDGSGERYSLATNDVDVRVTTATSSSDEYQPSFQELLLAASVPSESTSDDGGSATHLGMNEGDVQHDDHEENTRLDGVYEEKHRIANLEEERGVSDGQERRDAFRLGLDPRAIADGARDSHSLQHSQVASEESGTRDTKVHVVVDFSEQGQKEELVSTRQRAALVDGHPNLAGGETLGTHQCPIVLDGSNEDGYSRATAPPSLQAEHYETKQERNGVQDGSTQKVEAGDPRRDKTFVPGSRKEVERVAALIRERDDLFQHGISAAMVDKYLPLPEV